LRTICLTSFVEQLKDEVNDQLRAPHSSSVLCVNFFKYWKDNHPIEFAKFMFEQIWNSEFSGIESAHFKFEKEQIFGKNEDSQSERQGFIDLEISDEKHTVKHFTKKQGGGYSSGITNKNSIILQIESKFTETFNP